MPALNSKQKHGLFLIDRLLILGFLRWMAGWKDIDPGNNTGTAASINKLCEKLKSQYFNKDLIQNCSEDKAVDELISLELQFFNSHAIRDEPREKGIFKNFGGEKTDILPNQEAKKTPELTRALSDQLNSFHGCLCEFAKTIIQVEDSNLFESSIKGEKDEKEFGEFNVSIPLNIAYELRKLTPLKLINAISHISRKYDVGIAKQALSSQKELSDDEILTFEILCLKFNHYLYVPLIDINLSNIANRENIELFLTNASILKTNPIYKFIINQIQFIQFLINRVDHEGIKDTEYLNAALNHNNGLTNEIIYLGTKKSEIRAILAGLLYKTHRKKNLRTKCEVSASYQDVSNIMKSFGINYSEDRAQKTNRDDTCIKKAIKNVCSLPIIPDREFPIDHEILSFIKSTNYNEKLSTNSKFFKVMERYSLKIRECD